METLPLNNKKRKHPIQKRAKDMNGYFSKNDLEIADRHMERYLRSLAVGGAHTKTTASHTHPEAERGALLRRGWGRK